MHHESGHLDDLQVVGESVSEKALMPSYCALAPPIIALPPPIVDDRLRYLGAGAVEAVERPGREIR